MVAVLAVTIAVLLVKYHGRTGDTVEGISTETEIETETKTETETETKTKTETGNGVDVKVDIVTDQSLEENGDETDNEIGFYSEEISDEIFERMRGKSYPDDCPVPLEELRYLHLLYKDIDGVTHEGEMICNAHISGKLVEIFRKLYENDYPIEHMSLVDDYDADDEASMTANNTSCFNFRYISGTTTISKHGAGLAVDINPLYNPYIKVRDGELHVEPAAGTPYVDRTADFVYRIDEDDLAYKLFTEAGFTWGGSWKSVKDYQHFEFQGNAE